MKQTLIFWISEYILDDLAQVYFNSNQKYHLMLETLVFPKTDSFALKIVQRVELHSLRLRGSSFQTSLEFSFFFYFKISFLNYMIFHTNKILKISSFLGSRHMVNVCWHNIARKKVGACEGSLYSSKQITKFKKWR